MAMMRSMVPLAELGGEGEDLRGDLAQATVLLFQAVQLLPLCSGRTVVPPTPELLGKDIDELQLLAMHALDPVDGDIVEDMRPSACFGQRLDVVGGVVQGVCRSCWRRATFG